MKKCTNTRKIKKTEIGKTLTAIEIKDNTNMQKIEAIQPNLTIIALHWDGDWIESEKIKEVNAANRWLEFSTFTRTIKLCRIKTNRKVQKNSASLPFLATSHNPTLFWQFLVVN